MRRLIYVVCVIIVAGGLFLAWRHDRGFVKMPSGLRYKLISIGDGPFVQPGQWMKLRVSQVCGDSILINPVNDPPQYQPYDSASMSRESYGIFGQVSALDSLIFMVRGDTSLARRRPAVARQCEVLKTYIKVEKILLNVDSVKVDMEWEKYKRMPDSLKRS